MACASRTEDLSLILVPLNAATREAALAAFAQKAGDRDEQKPSLTG
jgi:hypothetical protein